MEIAFYILSAITLLGAVLAVGLRNLIHCVLGLVLFFLGIAGHYFLLRADFLGAVQILVYIGAVAVLILFAIMLTRNVTGTTGAREALGGKWWAGAGAAAILGGLICGAILRDHLGTALARGKPEAPVKAIGELLVMTDASGFSAVVPLEIMAVLLTAALIGAIVVALEEVGKDR